MEIKKLNPEDLAKPNVGGAEERSAMKSSNTDNLTSEGDEEIADKELTDGDEHLENDVDEESDVEEESIDVDDLPNEEDVTDESDEISEDDEESEDRKEDVFKAFSKN